MSPESRAERTYATMARWLLPPGFSAEALPELREVFRDGHLAARRRGRAAIVGYWARSVADLLVTSIAERRAMRRGDRSSRGSIRLDIRSSLRELRQSPAGSAAAIGTLGLGIAATVLMLALVRGILLSPLQFERPDRLVRLLEVTAEGRAFWPSWPNIEDWRAEADVFGAVIAADIGTVKPVIVGEVAERAAVGRVSRAFFRTLGVAPIAGRDLRDDENHPGAPAVALVSEEFWRNALGGRPLEGLNLELDADRYAVVGVVPAGFRFLGNGNAWLSADVWVALERTEDLGGRGSHGYHTIGRLRDGVSMEVARQSLASLAHRLKARHGEETDADGIRVERLSDVVVADFRTPLRLLLVAAISVLLVACLNLGGGLLARGMARRDDLRIRAALGASRRDLIRLQLSHALVLALPGAALGTMLAASGLDAIRVLAGSAVPRLESVTLDMEVVGAATVLALATAVATGLLPALTLASGALTMRRRGASEGRRQRALWDGFVAGQIAITLALLVSAALLVRSLMAALAVDLGYRVDDVLIASIALPESRYQEGARRVAYYDELLDRLRGSPGVESAGLVSTPPEEIFTFTGGTYRPGREDRAVWGGFRLADPGYFRTLDIPVLEGTLTSSSDAVMLDELLVDGLFDGDSPAGSRLVNATLGDTAAVGGVVGSVRTWDRERPPGAMYMHYARHPARLLSMYVVARGPTPASLADAMRSAAFVTDPLVPIEIENLRERANATMTDRRLMLAIAAGFAVISLLLAAAGVHALVAQAAARRRRETGIRIVLGAHPARIRQRVFAHGMRATLAGLAAGSALSWLSMQVLQSQLFGIGAADGVAIAAAATTLLGAAGLAAWLPARSAARVDPVTLLRDP